MVLGNLEKYCQETSVLFADALCDASAGTLVGAFYRVPSSLCVALNSGLNEAFGRDLILSDRSLCELFGSMPISFCGEQISSDSSSRNESGNAQTLVTNTLSTYYSGGGGVFKYLKLANFEQASKTLRTVFCSAFCSVFRSDFYSNFCSNFFPDFYSKKYLNVFSSGYSNNHFHKFSKTFSLENFFAKNHFAELNSFFAPLLNILAKIKNYFAEFPEYIAKFLNCLVKGIAFFSKVRKYIIKLSNAVVVFARANMSAAFLFAFGGKSLIIINNLRIPNRVNRASKT